MRIDLHTHSNRSDGTDTPGELVERARQAALDVVALTDHDVADGWDEAQVAADRAGIRLLRGMEISTQHEHWGIHLLAYDLRPEHPPLAAELRKVLDARTRRIPLILQRLAAHGIQLTEAEVAVAQGDARVAGRPHIADAMVAAGYVRDRRQAFDEWLGEGRPGRVTKYNIPIFEAIALVAAAGGRSVVAHPWGRGSRRAMTPAFFAELADAGLDGIEVDHNDHLPDQRAQLRTIAHDLGLVATGSSDYHGAGKTEDFRLGANLTEPEEFEKLLG
jgi:predicted metal-dependent phosphoesterase TrpH